jgi:hypothetical protein
MTRAKKEWRAREAADAVEQDACLHGQPNTCAISREGGQLLLRPPRAAVVVQRVRPGWHRPQLLLPCRRRCARPPRRPVAAALHDAFLLLGLAFAPPAQRGSALVEHKQDM